MKKLIVFSHRVQVISLGLAAAAGAATLIFKYVAALDTAAQYAGYALAAFLLLAILSAEKQEGESMDQIRKSSISLTLVLVFGGALCLVVLYILGKVLSTVGLVDPDWVNLVVLAAGKGLSLVRGSLAGAFLLYLVILKVKIIRFNKTGKI